MLCKCNELNCVEIVTCHSYVISISKSEAMVLEKGAPSWSIESTCLKCCGSHILMPNS